MLEVGILQIDIGVAVSGGGQVDQPATRADQRRKSIDQYEVAQMVGAELGFEAIGCMTEWRGHHAGIRNQHIELRSLCQQRIRARAHTLQAREVELDNLEATAA